MLLTSGLAFMLRSRRLCENRHPRRLPSLLCISVASAPVDIDSVVRCVLPHLWRPRTNRLGVTSRPRCTVDAQIVRPSRPASRNSAPTGFEPHDQRRPSRHGRVAMGGQLATHRRLLLHPRMCSTERGNATTASQCGIGNLECVPTNAYTASSYSSAMAEEPAKSLGKVGRVLPRRL